MSEAGDYDPGPWTGYSFKTARKTYDRHVGRSYGDAVSSGKDPKDLVPGKLETKCISPLVIACDVTGSMGDWPATIFSKLPYLELEGKEYLGEDMEISFAAVGDAYCDNYPLQVRPFTKGTDLEKRLKELVVEGGGGGQIQESYDLAALYYARNVEMSNAVNPIFIFIGDEKMYPSVDKKQAKNWTYNALENRLSAEGLVKELQRKYSVYLVIKSYDTCSSDGMTGTNKVVYDSWKSLLGEDHIAVLPDASRVVDVIFGILAKETGRIGYFEDELKDRQDPGQIKTVLKSLNPVHYLKGRKSVPKLMAGKSVMKRSGDPEKSKSLI